MSKLNISQAAKAVGVSRSTFYRHIENKGISTTKDDEGNPLVDTARLTERSTRQRRAGWTGEDVSDLERKLYAAQAALDLETVRREAEEAAREKAEAGEAHWRAQAERLTLLLTDQRNGLGGHRRPWWQRIFGGGSERHEPGKL